VDIHYTLNGFDFVWDEKKAQRNVTNHEIRFEEACEVFFDPFYIWKDASRHNEQRWGLIGYSESNRMLFVVSTEQGDDAWRIISARKATKQEKLRYEKTNAFN
jgi:uncharacterized DUF497 family protein